MGYKKRAIDAVNGMLDYDGFRDGDIVSRRGVISILSMLGEEPAMKWVPVEEQLPEPRREVLVWYEVGYGEQNLKICRTGHVGKDGVWDGEGTLAKLRAVAWMPLPEMRME